MDRFKYTSPVGSFAANKLGRHDMGANVSECCEDWFDPAVKFWRVLRVAYWDDDNPDLLLSSCRGIGYTPGNRGGDFGFQCVLTGRPGG